MLLVSIQVRYKFLNNRKIKANFLNYIKYVAPLPVKFFITSFFPASGNGSVV
jgi:hypothetical protein